MSKGRVLVKSPRVQNIGFKLFLLNLAGESNLAGFQARNIGTDCVEVLYEGSDQEIREFMEKVKEFSPREAEVSSIEFKEYDGPVKRIEVFRSEFTTIQLGKIVEIGLEMSKQDNSLSKQDSMLDKQDGMLGKLDQMLEKQDLMLEKQDAVLRRQDQMLEKQDTMIEKIDGLGAKVDNLGVKIDGLREDLKSMFDRRLTTLERDVALIKNRLGIA
jgi:acylphosphatase